MEIVTSLDIDCMVYENEARPDRQLSLSCRIFVSPDDYEVLDVEILEYSYGEFKNIKPKMPGNSLLDLIVLDLALAYLKESEHAIFDRDEFEPARDMIRAENEALRAVTRAQHF